MAPEKLDLQRSALEDHQRVGKELVPPFQRIGPGAEQIFWLRDLLPEFLWIDSLVQEYGQPAAVSMFNDFLSAADQFNQHPKEILDGTVGAFRLISQEQRPSFVDKLAEKIDFAVVRPFKYVLSLYPECPMAWMAPGLSPGDRETAITAVRDASDRLFAGKDPHGGFCRALPLNRFFAHNKVLISNELNETIEAIRKYPHGDKYRAESFARIKHGPASMVCKTG